MAEVMGITIKEAEAMLSSQNIIEIDLTEKWRE